MSTRYEVPKKDKLARISIQNLIDMVYEISTDDSFIAPSSVTDAITHIITIIQNSYDNHDRDIENPIQQILSVIQEEPVPPRYRETSKSVLAGKPLIVQLLVLMQRAHKDRRKYLNKQILWLAIAMHTAVLLHNRDKKTVANQIMMQFKLAIFFTTLNRRWIWTELPEYLGDELIDRLSAKNVLSTLIEINHQIEQKLADSANRPAFDVIEKNMDPYLSEKKSQISKILTAYERAHYPNAKNKKKPIKNNEDNVEALNDKPIKLSASFIGYSPANESVPQLWDTPIDDVEQDIPSLTHTFLKPEIEEHEGIASSFEEEIDSQDTYFANYQNLPNPYIRHNAPLQSIDLSLQQNYISQRELGLNSNTRLLSLASYKTLFGALVYDAYQNKVIATIDSMCAQILLLSMITALPINSLMTQGYIGGSKIFQIGDKRAYIQHRLGITDRAETYDAQKHENQSDIIKTPIPRSLVEQLIFTVIPTKEYMRAYLKSLRLTHAFPYLSLARIESALHVVLSRYTPYSHSHIADIICRIPAPHAPAMYYSSHSSEELIAHYKAALTVLNTDGNFDLAYITAWHKYTTGSGFALTLEYVQQFVIALGQWIDNSTSQDQHFDRTSIYIWFIFCLLTGIRPNNGIGKISDLDFNVGWLLIDDKPNKSVTNHRLVPLCPTLIKYLKSYQDYLINYQLNNPLKQHINETVDQIRSGDDVALLRLLSGSHDEMILIKRGMVYKMTSDLIDMNPYWTRHFVRTQLERQGIEIALINGVIGHEKSRQEVLGRFSSLSKQQIKSVGRAFEEIADQLGLSEPFNLNAISLKECQSC